MTNQKTFNSNGKAVVVTLLGAVLLFILAIGEGPAKWVIAAFIGAALIAFLIPVLREMRGSSSK